MLWIPITIAFLISIAAMAYVVWPMLNPEPPRVVVEDDALSDLIERKDATLQAIKDLEFDYRVGKLNEEDYNRVNLRLRRQAIAYIQQIEKITPQSEELDQMLEAEIARARKVQERSTESLSEPISTAAQIAQPGAASASYCTNCGQPLASEHKFCAHCGTSVAPQEPLIENS